MKFTEEYIRATLDTIEHAMRNEGGLMVVVQTEVEGKLYGRSIMQNNMLIADELEHSAINQGQLNETLQFIHNSVNTLIAAKSNIHAEVNRLKISN